MYLTESENLFSINVVFALKSFSITNSAVFFILIFFLNVFNQILLCVVLLIKADVPENIVSNPSTIELIHYRQSFLTKFLNTLVGSLKSLGSVFDLLICNFQYQIFKLATSSFLANFDVLTSDALFQVFYIVRQIQFNSCFVLNLTVWSWIITHFI